MCFVLTDSHDGVSDIEGQTRPELSQSGVGEAKCPHSMKLLHCWQPASLSCREESDLNTGTFLPYPAPPRPPLTMRRSRLYSSWTLKATTGQHGWSRPTTHWLFKMLLLRFQFLSLSGSLWPGGGRDDILMKGKALAAQMLSNHP